MTTAAKAKKAGFSSLIELADMYGTTTETLRQYDGDREKHGIKFDVILTGCLIIKLNSEVLIK